MTINKIFLLVTSSLEVINTHTMLRQGMGRTFNLPCLTFKCAQNKFTATRWIPYIRMGIRIDEQHLHTRVKKRKRYL